MAYSFCNWLKGRRGGSSDGMDKVVRLSRHGRNGALIRLAVAGLACCGATAVTVGKIGKKGQFVVQLHTRRGKRGNC